MKEKRNFKQEIKDWWNEHKKAIKTGVVCGLVGIGYGFIKGLTTSNEMWLRNGFTKAEAEPEEPCDELELDETNCDDPELLELIRLENEEA